MADEFTTNSMEVQQAVNEAIKKRKKKKWGIVLIVIGVLIFLGVVFGGSSNENSVDKKTEPINNDTVSSSQSTTAAPKIQKIKAGTAISTNEFKISYMSCNADFKGYSRYATIGNGNKVIRAEFVFENISDSDRYIDGFDCYADGVKCESFYSVDDYSSSYDVISAGRKSSAVIYFEVPANAEEIELEYESDFWTDKKIIFVVE